MSTINSASHRRYDLENPSHCHIADFTVSERIEANTEDDGEVGVGGWVGERRRDGGITLLRLIPQRCVT